MERNTVFLVAVLQAGLEKNFAEVQVNVVECPDLTKDPFQFPVKGKDSLLKSFHVYLTKSIFSKKKKKCHTFKVHVG